jgi:transcriptional regulator with XRE-family HTH domain
MWRARRIVVTLGDRIKAERSRLRLTQAALAEAVGVDQSTISDIERGATTQPSAEALLEIAAALRVTPQYLVFGSKEQGQGAVGAELPIASEEMEDQQALLRVYQRLSPGHKRALLAIARTLRDSERNAS